MSKAAPRDARIPTPLVVPVVIDVAQGGRMRVVLVSGSRVRGKATSRLPSGPLTGADPGASAASLLTRATGLTGLELVDLGAFGALDAAGAPTISLAYLAVRPPLAPGQADTLRSRTHAAPTHDLPALAELDARITAAALHDLANRRPQGLLDGQKPARKPTIVFVAGLTASGKSTFCRSLCTKVPGLVHLDVDAIRRALTDDHPTYQSQEAWATHNTTRALAEWCLRSGRSVVVDATGLTAADRAHYLGSAPLFGARTHLVWLETDEASATARLARRAAGADPADASSANMDFRLRSMARLERPNVAEADALTKVVPANLENSLRALAAELRRKAR